MVETDLGEWVVQLGNDTPSHIIMPIIHKRASQVAELFRRTAGATDADVADVPSMTKFARGAVCGRRSSRADLGISGVNFGVAETGSICICTNEGNGRLVTTLPRVHVAMMGIERLVPDIPSLGTVLQVLARSATGQNLTVYTNILTGPRRPGEADGPEELHVVLLDNGRSRVLGSTVRRDPLLHPVRRLPERVPRVSADRRPRLRQRVSRPDWRRADAGAVGQETSSDLPHASSLCGACREVCPVRIDIPRMLLNLRAEGVAAGESPLWIALGMRVFGWIAARPTAFRWAGRAAAQMAALGAKDGWLRYLPGPLAAWTKTRDFPAPAHQSFTESWKARKTPPPRSES